MNDIPKDIKSNLHWLEEQDLKYPNRHKDIHKGCCKYCPSNNNRKSGIIDPETEDFKKLPKDIIATKYVFVCAWRPNKLCKGLCDNFDIDEEFIKKAYEKNDKTI